MNKKNGKYQFLATAATFGAHFPGICGYESPRRFHRNEKRHCVLCKSGIGSEMRSKDFAKNAPSISISRRFDYS